MKALVSLSLISQVSVTWWFRGPLVAPESNKCRKRGRKAGEPRPLHPTCVTLTTLVQLLAGGGDVRACGAAPPLPICGCLAPPAGQPHAKVRLLGASRLTIAHRPMNVAMFLDIHGLLQAATRVRYF